MGTLIEAAFELGRSGRYQRVTDIKRALKAQGYCSSDIEGQLFGRSIVQQLQALCKAAKARYPAQNVATGFIQDQDYVRGLPVGLVLDAKGALLVADDLGGTIWRVSAGP